MTIEASLDEVFGAAPDVVTAYLYGSAARGELRPGSDIDVGVVFAVTAAIISPDRAATLRRMVGFRNVLLHGYDDVDLNIVRDIVTNRLDDLTAFAGDIRAKFPV